MADLDERIKILVLNAVPDENESDTFAQRAESYYQQRPQLLSLLQDLYNAYLSLADRHSQSHSKSYQSSKIPIHHNHDYDSDAESAISFQHPLYSSSTSTLTWSSEAAPPSYHQDSESFIAEVVIKNVEYNLMEHELSMRERRGTEMARKVELQKSLLEVLESERIILLNENARLEYKLAAAVEENKGLASESMFMKRKAGELARCVMKMREDHRVCLLSSKIEALHGQIFGLEKRNKEYYEQLLRREKRAAVCELCKAKEQSGAGRESKSGNSGGGGGGGVCGRVLKWWEQVKRVDVFLCGPRSDAVGS